MVPHHHVIGLQQQQPAKAVHWKAGSQACGATASVPKDKGFERPSSPVLVMTVNEQLLLLCSVARGGDNAVA